MGTVLDNEALESYTDLIEHCVVFRLTVKTVETVKWCCYLIWFPFQFKTSSFEILLESDPGISLPPMGGQFNEEKLTCKSIL